MTPAFTSCSTIRIPRSASSSTNPCMISSPAPCCKGTTTFRLTACWCSTSASLKNRNLSPDRLVERERRQIHLLRRQGRHTKKAFCHLIETLDFISDKRLDDTGSGAWTGQQFRAVQACAQELRATLRRVDQGDVLADDSANNPFQQWVMRATEDECVNAPPQQWRQVGAQDRLRDFVVDPTFFDQWHQQRTGTREHSRRIVERKNGPVVRLASHRRGRADHANAAVSAPFQARLRAGCDDAKNWHGKLLFERGQRPG